MTQNVFRFIVLLVCFLAAVPCATIAAEAVGDTTSSKAGGSMAAAQPSFFENGISVERATLAEGDTCVALVLRSTHNGMDALTAANTDAAKQAVLIDHRMHRDVPKIEIWPDKPLELERGIACIILRELKRPLKAGDSFELKLVFERSAPLTVPVKVVAPSGPRSIAPTSETARTITLSAPTAAGAPPPKASGAATNDKGRTP